MIISEKHGKLVRGRDVPFGVWCSPREVPKSLYYKDRDAGRVLVIYSSLSMANWYEYLALFDNYNPVLVLNQRLAEEMNQVRDELYAAMAPKKPFVDQYYTKTSHNLVSRVLRELNK